MRVVRVCDVAVVLQDLSHKARVKLQQEQMHEWAMQQTKEKRRRQQEQDHSDHLHDLKAIELDQRALQVRTRVLVYRRR